jgi:hypothetical protein
MWEMFERIKPAIDWSAIGVAVSAFAGWLPSFAALFSIIWLGILIVDRIRYGPKKN